MATTSCTRSSSASKGRTGATGGSTHSTMRSCATGRCPLTALGEWPPWKCSWRSKSRAGRVRKPLSGTRYLRSTSAVKRMPFQTFHRCAPFQSFKSFKERKRGTSKTHAKFRRQVPQCDIQTTERKFLFFRLTRQPAEVRFCAFAGYLEQTLLAFVADDERKGSPGRARLESGDLLHHFAVIRMVCEDNVHTGLLHDVGEALRGVAIGAEV